MSSSLAFAISKGLSKDSETVRFLHNTVDAVATSAAIAATIVTGAFLDKDFETETVPRGKEFVHGFVARRDARRGDPARLRQQNVWVGGNRVPDRPLTVMRPQKPRKDGKVEVVTQETLTPPVTIVSAPVALAAREKIRAARGGCDCRNPVTPLCKLMCAKS